MLMTIMSATYKRSGWIVCRQGIVVHEVGKLESLLEACEHGYISYSISSTIGLFVDFAGLICKVWCRYFIKLSPASKKFGWF